MAAILANVLVERGDLEEAARYAELAERLADADDTWSQAAWRTARAGVLVRRGELADADRLATEAVELVRSGDDLALRAETLVTAGAIRAATGHERDAAEWLDEALAIYEAKGDWSRWPASASASAPWTPRPRADTDPMPQRRPGPLRAPVRWCRGGFGARRRP